VGTRERSRHAGADRAATAHRHRFRRHLSLVLHRQAPPGGRACLAGAGGAALRGAVASLPAQPADAAGGHGPGRVPRREVWKCGAGAAVAGAQINIIQEGTVGLIEAVEKYDHERGVAFSLYALHRIRGRMLNFIKKENSFDFVYSENIVSEGSTETFNIENIVDQAASVMQQAETNFLVDELKSALNRLPQKEQLVLNSVYLNNQEPREVAQSLAVSTTHVYRLQKAGIRRVRGMLSKLMQHWQ